MIKSGLYECKISSTYNSCRFNKGEEYHINIRYIFNFFRKTFSVIVMPLYVDSVVIRGEEGKNNVYKFAGIDIYVEYKDINDFKKYWEFIG